MCNPFYTIPYIYIFFLYHFISILSICTFTYTFIYPIKTKKKNNPINQLKLAKSLSANWDQKGTEAGLIFTNTQRERERHTEGMQPVSPPSAAAPLLL